MTMNKDERTMQAFGTMFGNMKEKLESQKEQSINQEVKEEAKIVENIPEKKEEKAKKNETKSKNATNTQTSRRLTRKEGETRGRKSITHSNYSIMFELDECLIDYFTQAIFLNRKTKKEYLNTLVRKDLIERLGLNKEEFSEPKRIDFPEMNEEQFDNYKNEQMEEQNEILSRKWEEYKKQWLQFINQ